MKRGQLIDAPLSTPDAKYVTKERLGGGTYGSVYRAHVCDAPADAVALKKIAHTRDEGVSVSVLREVEALRALHSHPNIIELRSITIDADNSVLELELMETDLNTCIKQFNLSLCHVRSFMRQLVAGVHYMHTSGFMHRDLKPHNILLDTTRTRLKLADFGSARRVCRVKRRYSMHVTTHWYRAPEIMMGCDEYTEVIDMWALGCIMSEMTRSTALFPASSDDKQMDTVCRVLGSPTDAQWPGFNKLPCYNTSLSAHPSTSTLAQHSRWLPHDGLTLLKALLTYAPAARITAAAAKAHCFIS